MEEKKYERRENTKAFFGAMGANMLQGAVMEIVSIGVNALIGNFCCNDCGTENAFGPTNFFGGAGRFI